MASLNSQALYSIASSSFARKQNLTLKSNENFIETIGCKKKKRVSLTASRTEFDTKDQEAIIPNMSTIKKQMSDRFRQGTAEQDGGYKEIMVIRPSEVGPDKNATIKCILNLLQETAINHLRTLDIIGGGFGVTPSMLKNNLMWVYTKLSAEIDHYPTWDDVIEIDTWFGPLGKNAFQKGWTIKNLVTGQVLVRASSIWMVMNEKTRRLSKVSDELRAEMSPFFSERNEEELKSMQKKIEKLKEAKYIDRNMKPTSSDIDMNNHVNNVKYTNWMIETIPENVYGECTLSSITLEFRRECGVSETIQSLCQPDDVTEFKLEKHTGQGILNGYLPYYLEGSPPTLGFTHLLQIEGENKNEEIVRGRTTWKRRASRYE
jgi:fatty acyl-ACP thioesterase B